MNCCLQKYTTHKFAYFIFIIYIMAKLNIQKIIKIQEVHQEIHAKQFLIFF